MESNRVYYIEWLDSYSSTNWQHIDELKGNTVVCFSVGYKVKEDDLYLTIASTYSKKHVEMQDQVAQILSIPKQAILTQKLISFSLPESSVSAYLETE